MAIVGKLPGSSLSVAPAGGVNGGLRRHATCLRERPAPAHHVQVGARRRHGRGRHHGPTERLVTLGPAVHRAPAWLAAAAVLAPDSGRSRSAGPATVAGRSPDRQQVLTAVDRYDRAKPLPPKAPALNTVENLWQFIRDNGLSNGIFQSYDDILDHACDAWRGSVAQPWRIMTIGFQEWAHGS